MDMSMNLPPMYLLDSLHRDCPFSEEGRRLIKGRRFMNSRTLF